MAIYHVEDYRTLESKKFLRLALRLPGYEGIVRARLRKLHETSRLNANQRIEAKKTVLEAGGEITKAASNEQTYLARKLEGANK